MPFSKYCSLLEGECDILDVHELSLTNLRNTLEFFLDYGTRSRVQKRLKIKTKVC